MLARSRRSWNRPSKLQISQIGFNRITILTRRLVLKSLFTVGPRPLITVHGSSPPPTPGGQLIFPQGAAERFPDKVEKDPEGARKLNVSATSSLAQAAAAKGAFLIYISTDYVFPGKPGDAPYNADAETKPPNLYGQTKLDGEKAALAAQSGTAGSAVVLRVPVLYGSAETPAESAVNVLLDAVWKSQTEDKKITMDHWAPRYPTNTEDVGRVCHGMFQKRHSSFVFSSFPFMWCSCMDACYFPGLT